MKRLFWTKEPTCLKVKRTSESLKANIALPGIVRNEKKALLTDKKSFCKEAENFFFPRVRTKRNQFKHLVVSSRQQFTRL